MVNKKGAVILFLYLVGTLSLLRTFLLTWNHYLPDFSVYYFAALDLQHGKNPYLDTTLFTQLNYPPISLIIFFPLTLLSYTHASNMWATISIFSFLLSFFMLKKMFKVSSPKAAFIFAFTVFSFPFKFSVGMGQINIVLLVSVISYLWYLQSKKNWQASLLLTLSIILKLVPLTFALPVAKHKRWLILSISGMLLGFLHLLSFFLWKEPTLYYYQHILPGLLANGYNGIYYNQSVSGFLSRLHADYLYNSIKYGIALFSILCIIEGKAGILIKTLFTLIIVLLINTFTWQHHLILLLIPIFYICSLQLSRAQVLLLLLSTVLLCMNIRDALIVRENTVFTAVALSHGTLGLMLLAILFVPMLKVPLLFIKKYTHFFVILFFFGCVCFITRPLIFHMNRYTFGLQDELLITWVMNWNIHAAGTNLLSIFHTNSYYPYLNTLAYSDTHFIASIIGFIPKLLFAEPIVVYNAVIIFALTSLAFCTYYLVFCLSRNIPSSIVAGTLVTFSSYTLSKFMHPQLLLIFFVPLCILWFILFIKTKRYRFLLLFCLCFLLQTYNSFLPGYFILVSIGIISAGTIYKSPLQFINKKNVLTVLITGLLLIPLIKPYLSVSKQFSYVRDIRDSIHFANRIEYTFYPSNRTNLNSFLTNTLYKNDKGPYYYDGYISLTFYVLLIGALLYRFFIPPKKNSTDIIKFLYIGLASWVMSLGPALQWRGHVIKWPFIIPLPYALFYYVVPGFNGLRNSARWEMLMLLGFVVVIGLGLSNFFTKVSSHAAWLITIVIVIVTVWEQSVPFQFDSLAPQKNFPPEYQFLRSLPAESSVIETPWYSWEMLPYSHDEQLRLYYSTLHFHNLVNGASGFSPPAWLEKARWFAHNFPNQSSIEFLKREKIHYLVVHLDDYDKLYKIKFAMAGRRVPDGNSIIKILNTRGGLKVLKSFPKAVVYEIL